MLAGGRIIVTTTLTSTDELSRDSAKTQFVADTGVALRLLISADDVRQRDAAR